MTASQGEGVAWPHQLLTNICSVLIAIVSFSLASPTVAETQRYQASLHEADWQLESSVFECRLSQTIPGYGEAAFIHLAGEPLRFDINGFANVIAAEEMQLMVEPPPWNFSRQSAVLAQAAELSSLNPAHLSLDTHIAQKLIAEMLTGMVPMLAAKSNYDSERQINIGLSPLRFKAAHSGYQRCASGLLPVNYDQVGRSTLFWGSGARQLSSEARQLLDNIVLYSEADERIVGFEVDSFTDTAGETRENLLLSEERAFLVTNYLISQGVDPETIATRAHGEREEFLVINPERTAADRDRNRRVNIVMVRR